ncbi:hypothetical protein HMPREF0208_03947 [Citrobacter koseri]|nr:hypothetical protein HMPREF3220_02413 [Citrobacter koseri]KWZ99577.1 hypothetical protein HMPREF3207_03914 [Citrobacter koseri]KXB41064.1 hypothetical protein HMPREF0208_03947 [Citrobacter koseri]
MRLIAGWRLRLSGLRIAPAFCRSAIFQLCFFLKSLKRDVKE